MKKIVVAGGCFWGVEAYLNTLKGITHTEVGYANGNIENPTYEQVCTGNTGFTEACYVDYDEEKISLKTVLQKYWQIIDPTSLNKQGNDLGSQYRTGIYYFDTEDFSIIQQSKEEESKKHKKPIVTEIEVLKSFYSAEEYHQKYLEKNPRGYCHIPRELLEE